MIYEKWERIFKPIMDEKSENLVDWNLYNPKNEGIISKAIEENRLWSWMEAGGIMWFELGLKTVNCYGIIICEVPCDRDVGNISFWSRQDEEKFIIDQLNNLKKSFTLKELKNRSLEELQKLEEKHL